MKNSPVAQYATRRAEALSLLRQIEAAIAADTPTTPTWGHCGSLGHVNERLVEVLQFLNGTTP